MISEPVQRLAAFAVTFLLMAGWELVAPWRSDAPRDRRWRTNFALAALDVAVIRFLLPMGAIGVAAFAAGRGWGVLARVALPGWLELVLAVVALDLAIYAQHAAFHAVPWLWRFHRVHHADEHLDASTGVRFHPGEAVLSLGWKAVVIAALGAPGAAVFVFELVLSLSSLFNHGNVALPARLERWARWIVVTPAMHRVHHSRLRADADSNYGFNLPWWDRVFGTYRPDAAAGEDVRFGIAEPLGDPSSLLWALGLPLDESGSEPRTASADGGNATHAPSLPSLS